MKHLRLIATTLFIFLGISLFANTEYDITTKDQMLVMGLELRITPEGNQAAQEIPKFWNKFFSEKIIDKIPNQKTGEILGLYIDYEGDHTKPYSLVIGCEVTEANETPEGMAVKTLPASKYAKFTTNGPLPQGVINTWQTVWQTPLERTYTGDFELYKPSSHPDKPEVDIYIAIK